MGLSGKVAIITGGAQGLGEGLTKCLLQHGVKVAMLDVQAEKGKETLEKFQSEFGSDNVAFFKTDVTSQEEFEGAFTATIAKFGGLDIVINNAGVFGESLERFGRAIDINLKGPIRGMLIALNYLRTDKGGRGGVILNIASAAAISPSYTFIPTYSATKSGLVQYSRCLALNQEVTKNGVRVNVLAPEGMATPMNLEDPGSLFLMELDTVLSNTSPAGRMTTEYVATNALELLDEDLGKNGQIMLLSKAKGKSYYNP